MSTHEVVVTLHVDAAEAVRAGHGRAGPQKLRIGEAELAQLTERQRDTLARHIAGEPGWSRPLTRGAPKIGTADLATLARLLEIRAEEMHGDGALLAREREEAQRDLSLYRHCSEAWARGPRALLCDLRVGTAFVSIDGRRFILRRRATLHTIAECEDGSETSFIHHAAVLPLKRNDKR